MRLTLDRPWLTAEFDAPRRVLSWAVNRPGHVTASAVVWREVRNADLPPELDVETWYTQELAARGQADAVAMLTSRDIRAYTQAHIQIEDVSVHAVATVGLSNAERVGQRVDRTGHDWGTINVGVDISAGLTDAGLIEAMSIATQARTAAVMSVALGLPGGIATGTGTDCIAVSAPAGDVTYAGLHTNVGEAIGRAVYDAVSDGAQTWMDKVRRPGVI